MLKNIAVLLVLTFTSNLFYASVLMAQDQEAVKITEDNDRQGTFSGEGELGFTMTSGNSDTESLNAKLSMVYEEELWRHTAELRAQTAKDNQLETVNRKIFSTKSDYKQWSSVYLFGALRYEDDAFSGYAFQRSLAFGLGWSVFKDDISTLDFDMGVGYKQSETDLAQEIDETIARLYGKYAKQLTQTTAISQELLIEAGEESTFSESITGLKVSVSDKLALKLGFHIKKSSAPPLGSEPTDKTTSITLVYGF